MDSALKVCIDRLLPAHVMRHQETSVVEGRARAIAVNGKPWINRSHLKVRFMSGTAAQRTKVKDQADWWQQCTNLHFDFSDAPDAEIRIAFDQTDGAWSYIGTDCLGIPLNQPTMNLGFLDGGTAAHEFGHAIGLAHEHQNPDGGIVWNEAKVLQDLAGPPNNWTPAQIRHNVLDKYRADQIMGTKFDPESIMLYFFPGSWVQSGKGTKRNDVLSEVDKAFVGGEQMYPKDAPEPTDAVDLKVNAPRRTAAAIGKSGEEDLFTFNVMIGGQHVIDTRGNTDLVMRLFGPDSITALIGEDDDGGVGSNPSISAGLVPGRYYAQVRHYNRTVGTGDYSIRVRRP
jgi:hypothetical protein